jgi:TetR/AcrR family transcriptional regulator, transcriptional repressor for nem operon
MDKAAAVFNLKGYHATSLSDVMRATGLEKGGIYNHFASKEESESGTFAHVVRQMRAALFESVRGKRGATERLEAVCGVFARIARGFPVPGGSPVMNSAIETDHADSALTSLAREAMEDWRHRTR